MELKTGRHRLGRLKRTLPRLALRRELLRRLEDLGEAVVLADDFAQRRREVREAIRAALEARRRAEAELAELSGQAATLEVPRPLLDQAETIERLHQGVGKYVSQVAERSSLLVRREDQRALAEQLLDDIRPGLTPEEAEGLRPGLEHWMEIQELIQERSSLVSESEQALEEAREADRDLAALQQELASLPAPRDPARLRRRVEEARRAGDLDRVLAESAAAIRKEEEQLRVELARLGLWSGALEELERLPVPPAETLERFREGFDAAAERRRKVEEQRREARAGLAESERRLEEIRLGGAVPSEDDLIEARERRDRLWEEVRAGSPPSTYERSVREADEIADRLRREAGRVQEQARLLADRDRLRRTVADLDAEVEESAAAERRLGESWRDLWRPSGIEPLPPRDMQPWTARQERLRVRAEALRVVQRDAAALAERREELRAALARELKTLREKTTSTGERSGELEPVLARGEELVRLLEDEARRHAQLAAALREAEARLARARDAEEAALADLEDWSARWGEAIAGLGLGRDALPGYVLRFQEDLKKAFQALGEAERLARQIAGLDRELEVFRSEVLSLASRTAPELASRPVEQTAVELHARLTGARRTADRSDLLERQSRKLEQEIREAEATRRSMEGRMDLLRQEAGCDPGGEEELDDAERRSAEHQRLTRDLHAVEQSLLEEGEGALLEELEREAEGVDGDALPGQIDQLAKEIEELEKRSGDLREELGREQRELEHRTGGDAAARAAERGQEILAGLREDVERYARLRLAGWVLRREIDRYREENQGPLLRRAGELFSRLTRGSFQGLQTTFDDRDDPVLVGLRNEGRPVRVEGMSSGTRDQLYLSLRLATLEKYLVHSEPLPFIVDDILIHFDDERSAATLEVLAGLAQKTQVILFTHHARVRDLAAGLGNGAEVFVRELA